jgi:hypothetical protein
VPASRNKIELTLLRLLLARGGQGSSSIATPEVLRSLDRHTWADEEHRVVYQSWRAARRNPALPLRQEMAAQATRAGHPEIDWPIYFQEVPNEPDLAHLLSDLERSG